MRAPLAILGLLLLASALPSAASNEAEARHWPFVDVAFTPQLACVFVFDTGGSERCEDFGDVARVGMLSVRIRGAGSAFAFADDLSTPGIARQLAVANCAASCDKPFPVTSTLAGRLHVDATGIPGTIVYVSVERTLQTTIEDTGLDGLLP